MTISIQMSEYGSFYERGSKRGYRITGSEESRIQASMTLADNVPVIEGEFNKIRPCIIRDYCNTVIDALANGEHQ